ncbi:DUF3108 domain-containing protein [Azospirillum sp. sgz302134]
MRATGAWLLAGLVLLPGLARAATLELEFAAYSGGLPLARGTVALTEEAPRYHARLHAEASPWLSLFTNFRYSAESQGTLDEGAVRPDRFRGERRLRRKLDVMALAFRPEDVEVRAEPPLSPDKAARVPAESRRGSVDPLSLGAAVILSASRAGGCGGRYPVFDGRRRYDVLMKPRGREELPPSRYRIAVGTAEVCAMTIHPVAGFQADRDPSKFFVDGIDRSATVWFGRSGPGGRTVPVTVEVPTDSGTVLVQTVAVKEG